VTTQLKDEERTRCEVWSRVMGYHRPVSSWNVGKQQEHADRKFFTEEAAKCHQNSC
jgi:anaerobic ribonucleoside-triphosphate reductase